MEQLINLLKEDLAQLKENKIEKIPDDFIKKMEQIIELNKKNPIALMNLSIYEVFYIFFVYSNLYEFRYDDIVNKVEEVKQAVNNWIYEKDNDSIGTVLRKCDEEGKVPKDQELRALKRLGINSLKDFNLKIALAFIGDYLYIKSKNSSVKFFGNINIQANVAEVTYNLKQIFDNFPKMKNAVSDAYRMGTKCDTARVEVHEHLISTLEKEGIAGITEIDENWYKNLSSNTLFKLCEAINKNLIKELHESVSKVEEINQEINKTPITKVLFELGINANNIPKKNMDRIKNVSPEELKRNGAFLLSLGLSPENILNERIDTLIELTEQQLSNIKTLLDRNAVDKKTVINKLLSSTELIPRMYTNYQILESIIDFNNTYYNNEILLSSPTELKNILTILAEYNLTKNNYMFLLCNYEYINIYDLMIENEIPLYLLLNICYTKNPIQTIKRIILCKELLIPYETENHTLRKLVTDESKFVCDDETLNNYYPDFAILRLPQITGDKIIDIKNSELVKKLEEHYRIEDCYSIGDAIISRPKFLKNYQKITEEENIDDHTLLSCFLNESIVSENQSYSIINELNLKKSYLL